MGGAEAKCREQRSMSSVIKARRHLSCTYLAHHELESVFIIIVIIKYWVKPVSGSA